MGEEDQDSGPLSARERRLRSGGGRMIVLELSMLAIRLELLLRRRKTQDPRVAAIDYQSLSLSATRQSNLKSSLT